jgi:hypothetical protein
MLKLTNDFLDEVKNGQKGDLDLVNRLALIDQGKETDFKIDENGVIRFRLFQSLQVVASSVWCFRRCRLARAMSNVAIFGGFNLILSVSFITCGRLNFISNVT